MAILGASRGAAAVEPATAVLHIDNCAHVSDEDLKIAKTEAARIYRAAGIRIIWLSDPLSMGTSSKEVVGEPRHLTLILTEDNAPIPPAIDGGADSVLGVAYRAAGRAYVFVNRVGVASAYRAVDRHWVLAWVIAHEVGHLLLAPNSHSSEGIMRAALAFELATGSHSFTRDQSTTMRAALGPTQAACRPPTCPNR